jgi:hypothetical protein
MKWAIIGIVALVVLGGVGYGVYRWTDAPERAQAWMDEQDLKNFPTQARRELEAMKKDLEERKQLKRDLEKDIIVREGREDWDEAVLKAEKNGLASVLYYKREVTKREKGIADIVNQVKDQEKRLIDNGTVDADTGKVPASHLFSISRPNGTTVEYTKERARQETDKAALDIRLFEGKIEMQNRVISKKKEYVVKLDDLIVKMESKISEMEVFIQEMEVEMELLKLEEDIASINAAINGEENSNKFGAAIAKFRAKQADFLADKELSAKDAPADDGYFADDKPSKAEGASASYWD